MSIERLVQEFKGLPTWEEKYRFLIERGRALAPYPETFRQDKFKVKGCQSQVWLYPELTRDGRIVFYGDSDAAIVKGILSVLLCAYGGRRPQEILALKPTFIEEMDIKGHLSMSRTNGLYSVLKQIGFYAVAFSQPV